MNRALPPSAPPPPPASRAAPRKAAAKASPKAGARAADVVGKPPRESTVASPNPAAPATTAKTARKAAVAASPAEPKPARPRRSTATPAGATAVDAAKPPPKPRRGGRARYHVYVIELSSGVLAEPRFLRSNPGYLTGKPCVYVGMTGLDPDVRFDKHKAGIQHNRYVLRYGLRLLPDLYEGFNPMRYAEAAAREVEIGIDLRANGWGVWQA